MFHVFSFLYFTHKLLDKEDLDPESTCIYQEISMILHQHYHLTHDNMQFNFQISGEAFPSYPYLLIHLLHKQRLVKKTNLPLKFFFNPVDELHCNEQFERFRTKNVKVGSSCYPENQRAKTQ